MRCATGTAVIGAHINAHIKAHTNAHIIFPRTSVTTEMARTPFRQLRKPFCPEAHIILLVALRRQPRAFGLEADSVSMADGIITYRRLSKRPLTIPEILAWAEPFARPPGRGPRSRAAPSLRRDLNRGAT